VSFDKTEKQHGINRDVTYTKKLRAGKRRTYFFDVRETKAKEYYLTITESVRRSELEQEYDRHKIFLYKEDFNRFVNELQEVVNHIKTELMPHYDYDEFARRQEAYEASLREEAKPFTVRETPKTPSSFLSSEDEGDLNW
jgi:hypothetical protein